MAVSPIGEEEGEEEEEQEERMRQSMVSGMWGSERTFVNEKAIVRRSRKSVATEGGKWSQLESEMEAGVKNFKRILSSRSQISSDTRTIFEIW